MGTLEGLVDRLDVCLVDLGDPFFEIQNAALLDGRPGAQSAGQQLCGVNKGT